MRFFTKSTNKEVCFFDYDKALASGKTEEEILDSAKRAICGILYTPFGNSYLNYSTKMHELESKYAKEIKTGPIPYKMTEHDKKELAKNPDYINDIPKLYIPGYDKAVSTSHFDTELVNEFYTRLCDDDPEIIKFVNNVNPLFSARSGACSADAMVIKRRRSNAV